MSAVKGAARCRRIKDVLNHTDVDIKVHAFRQSLLEDIHDVALTHMKANSSKLAHIHTSTHLLSHCLMWA